MLFLSDKVRGPTLNVLTGFCFETAIIILQSIISSNDNLIHPNLFASLDLGVLKKNKKTHKKAIYD